MKRLRWNISDIDTDTMDQKQVEVDSFFPLKPAGQPPSLPPNLLTATNKPIPSGKCIPYIVFQILGMQ